MPEEVSEQQEGAFAVTLDVFAGPFSVLLSLIARRKLDVTEVALSEVTDEFIEFIRAEEVYDLSQVSEFLLVAATLLELKASRLIPGAETDEEDLELLERRDILFAKLLQYRAYKEASAALSELIVAQGRSAPRDVPLDPEFADAVPEVQLDLSTEQLAMLAVQAISRDHEEPVVLVDHLHSALVSIDSQITYLRGVLDDHHEHSFEQLCANATDLPTIVSRFMAVLELMRSGDVVASQAAALETILISLRRQQ
ncbi:MAG: segregation and condensation protein A [Ancrocorticia sp.]|uniref:segregation and condensation protein A n=1 Tax=Ancrocorticia sp. TaxID=2593684 RepID=UPI003F9294A4